ncbi:unnamed protein product [Euphydryas editha]|uniref:Mariner Mos1 transposase n=1 Tax=Euphydryas editha TaxID=104508 RepID=A0AAU9THV0_EUPED|nr:unnamed protein product [Euphydryas editha]
MSGQYYTNLLTKVCEAIVQRNDVGNRTTHVTRQTLKDKEFSEIDHPPYSPDLVPSDFFLFSNLKKDLPGWRFADDNEMKTVVDRHSEEKDTEYFFSGLKALYARSEKCISLEGDYIEK